MVCLVAALAFVLAQDVPPPVRVPGHVNVRAADRAPAGITLFDGFDAYERLVDAFASADDAARLDPQVHARADRALDDWQRGERRAAVEAWTRLALELRRTRDELDLLAAALRLECVEDGHVTRIRRGYYAGDTSTRTTQVRVRALFPVPELAARSFGDGAGRVVSVDLPFDEEDIPADSGTRFPIAFDESGGFEPVVIDLPVGPMSGPMETGACDVALRVAGRTLDRIRVHNVWFAAFFPFPAVPDSEAIDDMLESAPIALRGAYRASFSRFALLVEAASLERSCEFLNGAAARFRARAARPRWQPEEDTGPVEWNGSFGPIDPEGQALHDGRSPYADRNWTTEMGPYWRTHAHGERDVPAWTLIPEAGGESPLPVVVVLHEAGFDEGWAVRLAGGGALFEEADRRGVAVLAPPNAALEADLTAFAALIESLAQDISVDRARVHVLAPASAAPLARRLAEAHPTLVASVVVLGEDDDTRKGVGRVLGLERSIVRALDHLARGSVK